MACIPSALAHLSLWRWNVWKLLDERSLANRRWLRLGASARRWAASHLLLPHVSHASRGGYAVQALAISTDVSEPPAQPVRMRAPGVIGVVPEIYAGAGFSQPVARSRVVADVNLSDWRTGNASFRSSPPAHTALVPSHADARLEW